MATPIDQLLKKNLAISHGKSSFQAMRSKVEILEMDDVLFHLNSAVLLPDNPKGASSTQGDSDSSMQEKKEKQEKIGGLKALAIVFRQYEFDPRKKILIAAHTDTSGGVESNFKLAAKRGESVVSLLTGDKPLWATTCKTQHRVEDYQQIMKYFYNEEGWDCNPGSIDNKCGNRTLKASGKFFDIYRGYHDDPETAADYPEVLPPGLNEQIRSDPNHFWPEIAWKAVFDFYMMEICAILEITRPRLEMMRKDRIVARWVDSKRPFVACGESFPLQKPEDSNYRSQRNRRVEILFFKETETPANIDCPPRITSVHKAEECPIWFDVHMDVTYINADYLTATPFHMKFSYYDRVIQDFKEVPTGLGINVLKIGDPKPMTVGHDFDQGIYTIRVLDLKKTDKIYFQFNTSKSPDGKKRQWIFTKSKTDNPELKEMTDADIAKLSFKGRTNYYDLPVDWISRNWFTRHDGNENAGNRFETILKNYKPFGGKSTSPGKPLVFSLDDIVLVDSALNQNINNPAGDKPQDLDQDNNKTDLSADSRVTVYYLDELADFKLGIHKPKTSHPYFSDIAFTKNLITDRVSEASKPRLVRLVIFCSGFYDVTDKRTTMSAKFKFEQNHILGARAAVLNDPSASAMAAVQANPATGAVAGAMKDYVQSWCGNYEFHYLHNCGLLKGYLDNTEKPLSYLIIYWQGRYALHPGTTAADIGNDWREKHEKFGITNAMTRTNRPYLLEKKDGTKDIIIKPYCHYEAKLVTDEANFKGPGGKHNCRVEVSKVVGAWMQPALAKFHVANYQAEPGYYGSDDYADVDSATYTPLTNHHEFGHATGLFDDYLYNAEIYKLADRSTLHTFFGLPRFNHPFTAPGGPYSIDYLARMLNNRCPRMRDFWHFVNWVNDESGETTNKKLKPFLAGTTFKLSHKFKKGAAYKILELDLWDTKYRDTCKSAYEQNNFGFAGGTGKTDLLLYRLGGGETANTLDPKQKDTPARVMNPRLVFDGILVIRMKLAFKFENDTHVWNVNGISSWIKQFVQKPLTDLTQFYWECSRDHAFKRIIMLFVPHFSVYDAPVPAPPGDWVTAVPADSHFNFTVKANPGKAPAAFNGVGKNISVDYDVDKNSIVKYLVGKTAAGAVGKNDFGSVATWLKDKLGLTPLTGGGFFNIKDLP